MAQKLTDPIIRKEAAPEKGARTLFDSEVKGFGIRIFASTKRNPEGARSFFLNYRVDGIERRYTIGEFPIYKTMDARAEAKELRKRIGQGEDPASDRRARREAPTVQDLIDYYISHHLPTKACFGTFRERDERRMLDLIGNGLGRSHKVADVHHEDVKKLHGDISRRTRIRANRVLAIASKMFSLALVPHSGEQEPWRQSNPCKGIKHNPEEGSERFFSPAEITAIMDALADERSASANCIRLIMLTGCRPIEAMCAKWPEFDAEAGFWCKPSAHTKQRKVHRVPLSAATSELIDGMRSARKGEWLFPGRSGHIKSTRRTWEAARKRAAKVLPTLMDARLYDLRHTFASVGAGAGMGLPIIGKLLGHTRTATTQKYAHIGDEAARAATEMIGKMITSG
jgi:integrase